MSIRLKHLLLCIPAIGLAAMLVLTGASALVALALAVCLVAMMLMTVVMADERPPRQDGQSAPRK